MCVLYTLLQWNIVYIRHIRWVVYFQIIKFSHSLYRRIHVLAKQVLHYGAQDFHFTFHLLHFSEKKTDVERRILYYLTKNNNSIIINSVAFSFDRDM